MLHKLRAALAVLGILIGVTAVIWLVAMGEGVSYQAQKQIEDLGARNIIVQSKKPSQNSSQAGPAFIVEYGLKREDFGNIMKTIGSIDSAVPVRVITREVRNDERLAEVRLVGCTPEYLDINHLTMARGRFIEDQDESQEDNVCVLASKTTEALFPYENPVGRLIQVDTEFYRIIGETESRDPAAAIGGSLQALDYNMDVYIPLETFRTRIGDMVITARSGSREGELVQLNQITLTVASMDAVDETAEAIGRLLDLTHKNEDYGITVPKELLNQARNLRMMFNALLVLIAGISLVVGGIGIMNIMLATVTERTREIGIRRALGAKQRDIIQQFLAETIVLSGTGGLLGVIGGFLCFPAVSAAQWGLQEFFPDLWTVLPPAVTQLSPRIEPWSIVVAFLISVGVGMIFGLYPARRAAMMDPIEALRHE